MDPVTRPVRSQQKERILLVVKPLEGTPMRFVAAGPDPVRERDVQQWSLVKSRMSLG